MKLENLPKHKKKKLKKVMKKVVDNHEFYEDISFLVPQIMNYYGVIEEKVAIVPYASVGIVFDSIKFINNMVDIINDGKNLKKLQRITQDFGGDNLNRQIQVICKKNRNRDLKNSILNMSRTIGDGLCFTVPTWIYGESTKVSSDVAEIMINVYKYLRQKGRNKAKEKGVTSFYAKIFNMEKSTSNKVRQKHEIIRLVNEEIIDYINTDDYVLKNKKFQKLDLYVKILCRYKGSFGVKKDWDKFLIKQDKSIKKTNNNLSMINQKESVNFWIPATDVWQFQRVLLMLEFLEDIKKSLYNIADKINILNKLKEIKKDIKNNEHKYMEGEYELVKFLIRHNKSTLKDVTYQMTIAGGSIVGEMGELVSYFKKTVLEIVGLFTKLVSSVFGQCIKIKKSNKKPNKKISKNAINILRMVKSIESLNLEYESFYNYMTRLNIYLSEVDLKWKDVANNIDAKEVLENALI